MTASYYFYRDHLYEVGGGNTSVYIHWNDKYGHLYSSKGYTGFYILNDHIYGPEGYTNLYLHQTGAYKYIYGADAIPFLQE